MTHAQLQAEVTRLCQARNLLVFTWPQSRLTAPGWVDVAILGPRGGFLAELKSPGAVRSPRQNKVARYLTASPPQYRLWYPQQLPGIGLDLDTIA